MHYIVGKPEEQAFSEKWNEFFKYFQKFNFFPSTQFAEFGLAQIHESSPGCRPNGSDHKRPIQKKDHPDKYGCICREFKGLPHFFRQ